MAYPSQESTMKGEFQGHPPRKPHLLPSDPWAEEAEESLQLKRDDNMVSREGGCQGGFGGCWSQYKAFNGPTRRQRSEKLPGKQEGYRVADGWRPKAEMSPRGQ